MITLKRYPAGTITGEKNIKQFVATVAATCSGVDCKDPEKLWERLLTEDAGEPSKPFDFVKFDWSDWTLRQRVKFDTASLRLFDNTYTAMVTNLETIIISGIPRFVADHLRTHTNYGTIHQLMSSARLSKAGEYWDYQPLRDWLFENQTLDDFDLITNDENLENVTAVDFREAMKKECTRKEIWNRPLSAWNSTTLAIAATSEGWEAMIKTRSTPATQIETRKVIEMIKEIRCK